MTNMNSWCRSACSLSACVTLLLALASAGCSRGEDTAAESGGAAAQEVLLQPGDIAVARDTLIADAVLLTGTLQPYRIAEVRAQVPGTIGAIEADRGDAVAAGQVLARLDAAGIRSAAEAARAGVAAAEAGEALARRQLESARRLHEEGALSAIELQGTQASYDAAAGQLAAARAQLASAAEAAGHATLTAPFAGVVSARHANLGEAVNPGQPVFTVVDARILELTGEVPVQQAARLAPGARVEFTVDDYPGERFSGTVARVEPMADPATRRVGVYLRLNNDGRLLGGVFATGRVQLGQGRQGVAVPATALRGSAESAFLWLVRGGTTVRQPVQVLVRDEQASLAQVQGELAAGDTVIVAPGEIAEGVPLRLISQPQASAGGEQ